MQNEGYGQLLTGTGKEFQEDQQPCVRLTSLPSVTIMMEYLFNDLLFSDQIRVMSEKPSVMYMK